MDPQKCSYNPPPSLPTTSSWGLSKLRIGDAKKTGRTTFLSQKESYNEKKIGTGASHSDSAVEPKKTTDHVWRNQMNMRRMIERNIKGSSSRMSKSKRTQEILQLAKQQQNEKRRKRVDEDDDSEVPDIDEQLDGTPNNVILVDAIDAKTVSYQEIFNPKPNDVISTSNMDTTDNISPKNEPVKHSLKEALKKSQEMDNFESTEVDIDITPITVVQSKKEEIIVEPLPATQSLQKSEVVTNDEKPKSEKMMSMCMATEDTATSVAFTPNGKYAVVAFCGGMVRLFSMSGNATEDRYGYLLGHLDEEQRSQISQTHVKVVVSKDGRYCFTGCRNGPRVVMAVSLNNFSHHGHDDSAENLQKYFLTDPKLRGFADATDDICTLSDSSRRSYFLLCGLGIGTLRLWKFQEPGKVGVPCWSFLRSIETNGNTVDTASFLLNNPFHIASRSDGRDLRLWKLQNHLDEEKPDSIDVPNSKLVTSINGEFAYGSSPDGQLFRINLKDGFKMTTFEYQRDAGQGKSRRSMEAIESVCANDNGKYIIACSSEGFVYSFEEKTENSTGEIYSLERVSSFSPEKKGSKFGSLAYISTYDKNENVLIAYSPNNANEEKGYIRMGSFDNVIKRIGLNALSNPQKECPVCHDKFECHWPEEAKAKKTLVVTSPTNNNDSFSTKPSKQKKEATADNEDSGPGYKSTKDIGMDQKDSGDKLKNLSEDLKITQKRLKQVREEADRRLRKEFQLRRWWRQEETKYEEKLQKVNELLHDEIKSKIEMEKKTNKLEELYKSLLNEKNQLVEKMKHDYELSSVKEISLLQKKYDDLIHGGNTTMNLSQLNEIQSILLSSLTRNADFSKRAIEDGNNECLICRDGKCVVVVYPCGHSCFCESCGTSYQSISCQCPVCQGEIVSLLRVYNP